MRGISELRMTVGSRLLWHRGCNDLRPGGFRSDPRFVGQTFVGRGPVAFSGCMGQCASTHSFYAVERPREVRAAWRALLQLLKKEPRVLRFGPSIPIETAKACALIGLHMTAEENAWRSDSGSSASSSSSCEDNVGNDALYVVGLHGSGDTIALFLQDWEVAKVALSCHIALDMLCQEMHEVERRRGGSGSEPV